MIASIQLHPGNLPQEPIGFMGSLKCRKKREWLVLVEKTYYNYQKTEYFRSHNVHKESRISAFKESGTAP